MKEPLDPHQREIVERCAYSYIGTRFGRGGRVPGSLLDCGGVPVMAAKGVFFDKETRSILPLDSGGDFPDLPGIYTVFHWRGRMKNHCREVLIPLDSLEEASAASVLLFRFNRNFVSHCGILTSRRSIIHAWDHVGKVVESPFTGEFAEKFDSAYDIAKV